MADNPGHTCRGFTLLEIIVALILFSLSFALILQGATQSMRNTLRAREYTEATLWAENKLDSLGLGEELERGSDAGRFDDRYSWQLEAWPVELDWQQGQPGNLSLLQVRLVVSWDSRGGRRSLEFVTLRAVEGREP